MITLDDYNNLIEKIPAYQSLIKTKQEMAMLTEAILVAQKYEDNVPNLRLNNLEALNKDLIEKTIIHLFYNNLDDLIQSDFIISDYDPSFSVMLNDLEKMIKFAPENEAALQALNMFDQMKTSFHYIYLGNHHKSINQINLINLLISVERYDILVDLMVSHQVLPNQKTNIMRLLIESNPQSLKNIFEQTNSISIPSGTLFKELLNDQIKLALNNRDYNESIVRGAINTKYEDEMSRFRNRDLIRFFIEQDIIDIHEFKWFYKEQDISSAAAGYLTGNPYLGNYLYSLPVDEERAVLNSDTIILEHLFKNHRSDFYDFITLNNFKSSSEKIKHLMNVILELQTTNPEIINANDLDKIIEILLRKTQKDHYKATLKAVESLKTYTDPKMIKESRANLLGILATFKEEIINEYPATTTIGEIPKTTRKRS